MTGSFLIGLPIVAFIGYHLGYAVGFKTGWLKSSRRHETYSKHIANCAGVKNDRRIH